MWSISHALKRSRKAEESVILRKLSPANKQILLREGHKEEWSADPLCDNLDCKSVKSGLKKLKAPVKVCIPNNITQPYSDENEKLVLTGSQSLSCSQIICWRKYYFQYNIENFVVPYGLRFHCPDLSRERKCVVWMSGWKWSQSDIGLL